MEIDTPEFARQFRPTIISSPHERCGTTLIQRLLNSSKKMIVFGENEHFIKMMPECVYAVYHWHMKWSDEFNAVRDQFIHNGLSERSDNLQPDSKEYFQATVASFYNYIYCYDNSSKQYGFQKWGIKFPRLNPNHLLFLNKLLPNAKYIYIYRDLIPIAKLLKAQNRAYTLPRLAQLAVEWRYNMKQMAKLANHPNTLLIRYESMQKEPLRILARLEAWCGIRDLDQQLMNRQINIFRNDNDQSLHEEELTEEELAVLSV